MYSALLGVDSRDCAPCAYCAPFFPFVLNFFHIVDDVVSKCGGGDKNWRFLKILKHFETLLG